MQPTCLRLRRGVRPAPNGVNCLLDQAKMTASDPANRRYRVVMDGAALDERCGQLPHEA